MCKRNSCSSVCGDVADKDENLTEEVSGLCAQPLFLLFLVSASMEITHQCFILAHRHALISAESG